MENVLNYVDPLVKEKMIQHILHGPWTLLMISDEEQVQKQADEIILMDSGKIAFKGKFEDYLRFKKK